jgi:hypothetical protein
LDIGLLNANHSNRERFKIVANAMRGSQPISITSTTRIASSTRAVSFFLAHLLMRYGVLRWLRTEKDPENNSERIICRNLVTDEEVVIESAQPTDEELVAIKREIDELLLGTLSSAAVESTSEESAPEAGTAPTSFDTPEA